MLRATLPRWIACNVVAAVFSDRPRVRAGVSVGAMGEAGAAGAAAASALVAAPSQTALDNEVPARVKPLLITLGPLIGHWIGVGKIRAGTAPNDA